MLPSWAAADEESNKRRKRLLIGGGIAAFALLVVVGTRKAEDASLSSYLPAGLGISTPYSFSSQDGQEFAEEWGEGVEQTEVPWSEEEERLREYKWETPEIDETLKVMLDGLNEEDRRTRDWLLATRPNASRGVGIGLGAASPPEAIRPAPPARAHGRLPKPNEGPGKFVGGSWEKYAELLEEWLTGRQRGHTKGKWEDDYAKLHAQILDGEREPMLLEYLCPNAKLCGGLGDRMLGITSTLLYAILTGRAFSVSWEHPLPFDLLFDSPNIDWSQRFKVGSTPTRDIYTNQTLVFNALSLNDSHNPSERALDSFWPTFAEHREEWIINEAMNRGITLRSFRYPEVAPQLEALGFTMDHAYLSLINYLIRPKPSSLAFIHEYTSFFALPSVFTIGIQIRTGDLYMRSPEDDLVNTVERHSHYFECAQQVALTYAKPSQKTVFFLITDSAHLRQDAVRHFPSSVVVSGLAQKHIEIGGKAQIKAESEAEKDSDALFDLEKVKADADGFMNTLAETWTFAGTDFQILTAHSGFGKIPTWLRGRPGSTIRVGRVAEHNGKVTRPQLDCRLDSSIATYSQLAESWSLG